MILTSFGGEKHTKGPKDSLILSMYEGNPVQ
jgi:hypothetical protein